MDISPEVGDRATRLFSGFKKSSDLTIRDFYGAQKQRSPNTVWRLLNGHRGTAWDIPTLEAFASLMGEKQQVPATDILHYLFGRESEHSSTYQEFIVAEKYVPRPQMMKKIAQRLASYDESAKFILSAQRFLPVSQMIEEVARLYNLGLTAPLGKMGIRMFNQLQQFSRTRHQRFFDDDSNFGKVAIKSYIFASDFNLLRDRKGCFAALNDESYSNCIDSLLFDCIRERHVRHCLVDDTRMPSDLLRFFAPYNGVMVIDDRFTMKWCRHSLARSICERSTYSPACNQHIDFARAQLQRLDAYRLHGDSIPEILSEFETYRL